MNAIMAIIAILFILFLYTRSNKPHLRNLKSKDIIHLDDLRKTKDIEMEEEEENNSSKCL